MKFTKSHACISFTILKIICWYGLIIDGLKDNLLISGYILKTEPERIMTTIDTLLPENFTMPPLVAIISINVCLILCISMRKFSYENCTWIEGPAGNFLKFVDNGGLSFVLFFLFIRVFQEFYYFVKWNKIGVDEVENILSMHLSTSGIIIILSLVWKVLIPSCQVIDGIETEEASTAMVNNSDNLVLRLNS